MVRVLISRKDGPNQISKASWDVSVLIIGSAKFLESANLRYGIPSTDLYVALDILHTVQTNIRCL